MKVSDLQDNLFIDVDNREEEENQLDYKVYVQLADGTLLDLDSVEWDHKHCRVIIEATYDRS